MDLFKLSAKMGMDTTEFERGMKASKESMQQAKKSYNEYMSDVAKMAAELRKLEGLDQGAAMKKAYASIEKEQYDLTERTRKVVDATEEVGEATEEATGKTKRHWWQLGHARGGTSD